MKNYIINKNTCALIKKGERTLIIEDNKQFFVDKKLKSIINFNYKYFGFGIESQNNFIFQILDSKYKNPILIKNYQYIILFPTASCRAWEMMYLNYQKIAGYKIRNKYLQLKLTNQIFLTLNISDYILKEQLIKCVLLSNVIKRQKKA